MRRSARSTVSAATTASAAAQRAVRVVLLDRTELTVFVEGKARVLDVFQHVCEHLSLRETEYFALAQLVDGEYQFMDENNKLHKIASKGWKNKSIDGERPVLTLYLRVQYYVEHISLLKERCTRQQYYLQLRDNLLHHSQLVSEEKCFLLAAYALQADHGDYSQSKHANSYFDAREYFPAWVVSQHHEDYIQTHLPVMHNDLCGMTRLEAMRHFIKDVSLQPTAHNLHFYKLKKRKTDPIGSAWLAICPRGIEICEETNGFKSPLSAYSWAEISKLHSDKKKFEIRVEGGADRKLTYYTSSEEWGKSLIAFCRRSHIFQLGLQPKLAEIRHLDAQDKRYRETYIYSENQELSWEHNSSCRSRQSLGSASRTSVPGMTGQNGCLAKAGSSASTSNKAGPTSGFDGSQRVSIVSNASSNTTSGIVSDKMHASLDESEDDRSHEILIDCPPAPAAATSFSSLWASTPQSIQGLSPIPSHPPLHRPASRTNSSQSHNSANFVLPTPVLPSSLQQTTPLASSHMQAPPSAPSHMQSPPSASSHMQAPHLAPTQMQALPPASSHMQAPPLTGPVPAEAHLQRMTFAPTMTVSSNPVRPGHPVAGAVSNSVTTDLSVPPAFSTPISHYHAPVQPRQLHEAYETGLQYSFERLQAQLEGGLQYGAQPDSYDVIEQQHETEVVSAMEIMAQLYPSPTPHQPPKSYNNRLQQEYILHQRQLQHQQNQQLQHQQNQQLQHQQNQQLQLQQNQQLQHQQNQQLQHQQNQQLQHQHNQLQHQQNHQLQHQQNQQLQHQQNQQLQHQQNQQLQHQQNQQLQQQMQQQQTPRQDHMLQALQQKLQAELQIQRQKNMQHQLQLQQKLEAVQGMSAGVSHSSILQPTYDNPNLSQSSAMQVERQRALSLHQQQQLQQSTTQRATSIGYTPHMMSSQAPPPQPGAGLQQHPPPYANSVMQFQPQPPPLYQASSILGHSQESLHHQQQQQQQQHPMLGQNGHMHVSSNSSSNSGLMPTPTTLYNHTHIYENLPAVQNAINASVLHKPLSPQNSGSGRPQTLPVSANNINLTPPLVGSPMSGAVPVLSAQAVRQAQMAERRRRSATVALGNPAHEYQPHQPEVKVTRAKSAATALPSYLKTSTPAELNNNMTKPGLVVRRERPAIPTTPNRHSGGDLVRAASEDTLDSKRRSGHLMSTCPVHSMRTVMDKIRGISSSNNVSLPMLTGLCNDPNLMVNNTCTCSSELGIKDPATKRFSLSSPPVTHFNEPGTSVRPVSWHSEILEQHLRDLSGGDEKSNGYASCGSQLSLPTSLPTPTTSPHSANSTPDAVHTFGSNQQLTDANQPVSGSGPLQKLHKYNGAVPKSSSIHNLMGAYLGVPGNGLSVTVADSRRAKSMVHVNGTLGVVPSKLTTGGHSPNNSDTLVAQSPGIGMA